MIFQQQGFFINGHNSTSAEKMEFVEYALLNKDQVFLLSYQGIGRTL